MAAHKAQEKTLSQLLSSIEVRSRSLSETVENLGYSCFGSELTVALTLDQLDELLADVQQAQRLERLITQTLAGMRLPAPLRDWGVR